MDGMKKAKPDQCNPRSEKGGPMKGLNPVYRVKKAGGDLRTRRDQLPKGPAGNGNLSRRHTKLAKR